MSIQPGEIYFVREIDEDSKSTTPFVKIGLVTSPRLSAERLVEHQTANPRKLTIPDGFCIRTDAVSMVEAQLHRRLAKFRFGGEWFKFANEEDLVFARDSAKQLSEEAKSFSSQIQEAELLGRKASSKLMAPPTEELEGEADFLDFNKKALKQLKDTKSTALKFIGEMRDEGEEVESVAKVRTVTYKPKFLQDAFAEDYPDVFAEYPVVEASISGRFQLKTRTYELSGESLDLSIEIDQIEQLVNEAVLNKSIEGLTQPLLSIERLIGLVTWNIEIATSRLKVACGEGRGIEGVCTWKRENKINKAFDTPKFVSDHPDLYTSYLSDEVTKEYVLPNKGSRRK
jgi:hypothetical protein